MLLKDKKIADISIACYHCGTVCDDSIQVQEKSFCCEGCKMVYQLLQETGLCNYYELSQKPGITVKGRFAHDKFAYLDNPEIQNRLIHFASDELSRVVLYLPAIHCASCVWLLENLHRINPAILESSTHFQRKEISILFRHHDISLRKLTELLAYIGYEPYISMADADGKEQKKTRRKEWLQIGVAGFCFSNIMMLSFPEYFSDGKISEPLLKAVFPVVNLLLALPVFFFSARPFFSNAIRSLLQRRLHIDAPITLAILVTFTRSVYEVFTQSGPGYFDSMSGTVFFMLTGRWFQHKTYDAFSFDRDYKSFFPMGATKIISGKEESVLATQLVPNDEILVRNEEMVPADSILTDATAWVDYSFVSGEQKPVRMQKGDLVYAGGKITGSAVHLSVHTPVQQSYITQLWNRHITGDKKNQDRSFVHPLSRHFTWVLLMITSIAAIYWAFHDTSKIMPSVTAALIVACPCFLLLASTFTYGNMMRRLGRNHLYLKNAAVIESMTSIDTIIFDKTGTLTTLDVQQIQYEGEVLTDIEKKAVCSLARQSAHPLSRLIVQYFSGMKVERPEVFEEMPGKGIRGEVYGHTILMGSSELTGTSLNTEKLHQTAVQLVIDGDYKGAFLFQNQYRDDLSGMIKGLQQAHYNCHVLSGDNASERQRLKEMFGNETPMYFQCSPLQKLEYVDKLNMKGKKVLMVGDGLNDAGALHQSKVGIAVSDQSSRFSPASDGIIHGDAVASFHRLIAYAHSGKINISFIFAFSILYNIIGLYFAVRGELSAMIAAILMPLSTISIVSLSWLLTTVSATKRKLA
jgi:Cu+-exporting ATPase